MTQRGGQRGGQLLSLNERWEPVNRMKQARDRRRLGYAGSAVLGNTMIVGDTNIDYNDHTIRPMVTPIVQPLIPAMVPPLIRKMGEDTIQQRRSYGNRSLWANTPVAGMCSVLGMPEEIDITDTLDGWDRVGWRWDRRSNKLYAYLTTGERTFTVKIPLKKLQRMFNKCLKEYGGNDNYFKEKTLDGFFKKLGSGLKKAVKGATRSISRAVTSPVRFVKNPKEFIRETGASIKKVVQGAGRVAMKVATSPVFAGAMTAISAIPPLTAVGAAGLAAYAAANAAKPAFNMIDKTITAIDKKSPGAAFEAISSASSVKAEGIAGNFARGVEKLPGPAKTLMVSALKATDSRPVSPGRRRQRRRAAFRFRRGPRGYPGRLSRLGT